MNKIIGIVSLVDDAYARAERAVAAASFLVMALVVFLDVVNRLAAGSTWAFRWTTLGVIGVLGVAGARTHKAEARPGWLVSLAVGAGVAAVVGLGTALFLWLMPNGVPWAQTFALVLTLWVGFLGASLATKDGRHLRVEAGEKLFPAKARVRVRGVAELLAAVFCGSLSVLAVIQIAPDFQEWWTTDGAGAFPGFPLPKWIAYFVLPLAFASMCLRFLARAIKQLSGVEVALGEALPAPRKEGA
jgi:TRAP-type C4-dicarboxylate transport system permease small subunit